MKKALSLIVVLISLLLTINIYVIDGYRFIAHKVSHKKYEFKLGNKMWQLGEVKEEEYYPMLTRTKEACIVCKLIITVTISELPNHFNYYRLLEGLVTGCQNHVISNYTHREFKPVKRNPFHGVNFMHEQTHLRNKNYTHQCVTFIDAVGDTIAALMWERWDPLYFQGYIVDRICDSVSSCAVEDPVFAKIPVMRAPILG